MPRLCANPARATCKDRYNHLPTCNLPADELEDMAA